MKQVGIFLDVSNLYYCVKKRMNGKINYAKYLEFVEGLGEINCAFAYGAILNHSTRKFLTALKKIGFKPKYKTPRQYALGASIVRKADWDVGITLDIIKKLPDLDIIVLGSADGDFRPIVEYAIEQGKDVVVLACKISKELEDSATRWIELPETFLEQWEDES